MKAQIVYGFSYYGWDDYEEGREYFFSERERNERMRTINSKKLEPFKITLTREKIYKLNFHGIAKDKREIIKLRKEIESLKEKLNVKIKLVYETQ